MIRVDIMAENGLAGSYIIDDKLLDKVQNPAALALEQIRPILTEIVERRNEINPLLVEQDGAEHPHHGGRVAQQTER